MPAAKGAGVELSVWGYPLGVQGCSVPSVQGGQESHTELWAQHCCSFRATSAFHSGESQDRNVPESLLGLAPLFCVTLHCNNDDIKPPLPIAQEKAEMNPQSHVLKQGQNHGSSNLH